MFLSFAMCFGLMSIGYNFAPIYFGSEFQKTGILIMMLSTTLPFLSFANVLRTQYLIPNEKDKIYITSVSLGAISNLLMNFIFIPKFYSIGACIGTIAAEAIVMIYQTLSVRRELPLGLYFKKIIPYFIKAFIMFIIIYPLNLIEMNSMIRLLLQVIIGGIIYFILNFKYILSLININKILSKLGLKRRKAVIFDDIDKNGEEDVIEINYINEEDNDSAIIDNIVKNDEKDE